MVGRGPFFLFRHDHGSALWPHENLVLGLFKVLHFHQARIAARRHKRSLVAQVGQVRPAHTGRSARNERHIHVLRHGNFAHVHIQDLLAAANVGQRNIYLPVKTAGTQQCLIENVRTVGGGHHDHAQIGFEPVHFNQHLVEGLLALVVSASKARTTLTAHGIDFINEDDAWGIFLGVLEHVAHTRSANTHKHFHKIGARNTEERYLGFASNGLGQQGLAGSRRAHQQQTAWYAATKLLEFLGISQEINYFLDFFLGLVGARHIGEGDLVVVLVHHARLAFAKAEGATFATPLHLAHEIKKHYHDEQDRPVIEQDSQQQRPLLTWLDTELDVRLDQVANQPLIHARGYGADSLVVYRCSGNFGTASGTFLDGGLLDLAVVDLGDEFGIVQRRHIGRFTPFKMLEEGEHDHENHEPYRNFGKPLFIQGALRSTRIWKKSGNRIERWGPF